MLVLALGIGANTAMFSVVNRALFTPLLFDDADRLVNVYQNIGESSQPWANSYPAYLDMAAYTDLFDAVAAFTLPMPVRYQVNNHVRSGQVEYATASYQAVHRLHLALGRWFAAEDDRAGASPVAVLSHSTWTARFGAAPSVLGKKIRISGVPVTVIGVGPIGGREHLLE